MAKAVVDRLEMIQIQVQKRALAARTELRRIASVPIVSGCKPGLNAITHLLPVGESSQ